MTAEAGGFDIVTFLSDFGRRDIFVGVCHGVIAARAPHVRIIDLTHEVTRHDVEEGAVLLSRAVEHLPGCVHLAVVDPGVGTERRGVAISTERGDVLVGPDNGLLIPAAQTLGGIRRAHDLSGIAAREAPTAATFHGRDVFAPAAAAVADGVPLRELGPSVDDLRTLDVVPPRVDPASGELGARVVLVDRFGNVQLDADAAVMDELQWTAGREVSVIVGDAPSGGADFRGRRARVVRTFGELAEGELGLYPDSDRKLALTVNTGSAAEQLGVERGARVTVRPA